MKINIDAFTSKNLSRASAAAIAMDEKGKFLRAVRVV
jgi:hypothetical protein